MISLPWLLEVSILDAEPEWLGTTPDSEVHVEGADWDDFETDMDLASARIVFEG